MEQSFLVQLLFLSSLIISLAAVDITLKNDDLIHSPFSEELENDANLDGPKVFTKEELSVYDGKNVSNILYFKVG